MRLEYDNYLKRLNPIVKLFAILLAIFTVSLTQNVVVTLTQLSFSLLLVIASRPKINRITVAGAASTLIGYSWVTYVLFLTNAQLDPIIALQKTMLLASRILIIILYSIFFVSTTKPKELATAFTLQLKIPYVYSYMTFVTLRMFPLVKRDLENMIAYRRIKNYISFSRPWRLLISIVTPLLFLIVRRSVMLGIAMEARGFGKYDKRVFLEETKIDRKDALFLLLSLSILVIALVASYLLKIPIQPSL